MSWFKGENPSREEMRLELSRYLEVVHKTKKHIPRTKVLLGRLWKRAHSRSFVDVWPTLGDMADHTELGIITGASIKSAFRLRVLLQLQGGRCCYCRRWLVNTAYAKPIEHILPRSHYPQFSIDFWNLAVACYDCNGVKSDHVWGSIPTKLRLYPRAREFIDMFHPRFHRYDDHIRYLRLETNVSTVVLFTGLTPQGKHLCSSLLYLIAAKETLIENNSVLAPVMDQLRSFEAKADGMQLKRFEAFRETLDKSIMRLID